jgi:hypothetical protein
MFFGEQHIVEPVAPILIAAQTTKPQSSVLRPPIDYRSVHVHEVLPPGRLSVLGPLSDTKESDPKTAGGPWTDGNIFDPDTAIDPWFLASSAAGR